jgi:copper homeostasis protein (lipoprotein)
MMLRPKLSAFALTLLLSAGPAVGQENAQIAEIIGTVAHGSPTKVDIVVQPVAAPSKATGIRMEGEFVYLADAGLFTDCRTGARYPVAMEKDNAALERAYAAARTTPGAPVLVVLEGRFERRPRMEGDGTQETLIVEKFIETRPGGTCNAAVPAAALEGTY